MRPRSRLLFLASLLAGALAGFLLSTGMQRAVAPAPPATPAAVHAQAGAAARPAEEARNDLEPEERRTIELFKSASRSVAFITTRVQQVDFWTRNVFEVPSGTGSGFLWDDRGHVVTNYHVVQGADSAQVTLAGEAYDASIVGYARDQDLAVLKVKAPREKLVPVRLGTSAGLQVGQKVLAIGNPFGLDHTLTTGILSALGRTIQSANNVTIFDVIQTDAAINPGNSGGPLLDSGGRLIGVNTAIYSPSGASAGIGFAVPADTVGRIVPELIQHGRVMRPVLGVELDARLSDYVTKRLGVEGALIRGIYPGTGAEQAGLRGTRVSRQGGITPGDVVTKIDDKPVASVSDLLGRLGNYRPGDSVTLTLWNDGKTREARVRLQAPE